MKDKYFDPTQPGAYRGAYLFSKGRNHKKVTQLLQTLDAYTKHVPYRRRFPRSKVITSGPNIQYQADLIDFQKLASYNDGYKYILIVIDVFSKRVFLRSLKNKSGAGIVSAFKDIFDEHPKLPFTIQSDQGREFLNKPFQDLLKSKGIDHFYTRSDLKSSIVERCIRTIRNVLERYFTANNTKRYIDVLDKIEIGYNASEHSSIGMAPNDVNPRTQELVWDRLYGAVKLPRKPDLSPGTPVRISKIRGVFTKSSLVNWTTEIFYVRESIPGNPPTYKLQDYDGEEIEGRFYRQELQPIVKNDDVYQVESIIKTRIRRGKTEYFVKWSGYPDKFNSWVTAFV